MWNQIAFCDFWDNLYLKNYFPWFVLSKIENLKSINHISNLTYYIFSFKQLMFLTTFLRLLCSEIQFGMPTLRIFSERLHLSKNGKCCLISYFLNKKTCQFYVIINENKFRNVSESNQFASENSLDKLDKHFCMSSIIIQQAKWQLFYNVWNIIPYN